jgi:predicted transcriptional regulator of viral defense system
VKKIDMAVDKATAAPKKKVPAKKPAVRKVRKQSPTVVVLQVIKSHKKGIDIPTLKKITGLPDNSIRNILYRASKEGRIKRIRRGVYASA